jgi:hypothetical protein
MRVCCIGPLGIQFFGYNTIHGYVHVSVLCLYKYRNGTVQVRADGMDPCERFRSALNVIVSRGCNLYLSNASGFKTHWKPPKTLLETRQWHGEFYSLPYTANEKRSLEKIEECFSVRIFRIKSSEKVYFNFTSLSQSKKNLKASALLQKDKVYVKIKRPLKCFTRLSL